MTKFKNMYGNIASALETFESAIFEIYIDNVVDILRSSDYQGNIEYDRFNDAFYYCFNDVLCACTMNPKKAGDILLTHAENDAEKYLELINFEESER